MALERAAKWIKQHPEDDNTEMKTQGKKVLEMISSLEKKEIEPADLNIFADELNSIVADAEGIENKKAA